MSKIAIITDSNSGITQAEAKEMGINVIPMPFFINGELHFEDIELTHEKFYELLESGADITTSQPSPGDIMDLWGKLLKEYDEIVHIPMSSGLSNSCETAMMLAQDYDGKVQVVDNQRISAVQKRSVEDAIYLAGQGYSAAQIKERLEAEKMENSIYLVVETLKYLKKGGRITPAVAAIGTMLNLKPVLQINGEKLDTYAKARGKQKAKKIIIDAMREDLTNRFAKHVEDGLMELDAVYAGNPEEAEEWRETLRQEFPGYDIRLERVSLSVACHTGPGVLAVTSAKRVR